MQTTSTRNKLLISRVNIFPKKKREPQVMVSKIYAYIFQCDSAALALVLLFSLPILGRMHVMLEREEKFAFKR